MAIKKIIIALFTLITIGCSNPPIAEGEIAQAKPEKKTNAFSNPSIIYGNAFGHFFQCLYRLGNFEALLKFTAKQTRLKYGSAELLKYYRDELKFDFELDRLTNAYCAGDTITLVYSNAKIMATRKLIKLNVIIENDSCKLLLSNLNSNPFY